MHTNSALKYIVHTLTDNRQNLYTNCAFMQDVVQKCRGCGVNNLVSNTGNVAVFGCVRRYYMTIDMVVL